MYNFIENLKKIGFLNLGLSKNSKLLQSRKRFLCEKSRVFRTLTKKTPKKFTKLL